jgi:tRNA threonylcarbamoyladenosine biosynthesis protein TsaB
MVADERGALIAPLVLAIESATAAPSVALVEGDRTLALASARPGASAAATVLALVEAVLVDASVRLSRVELFAVAIGPGSFTGLRVGLATVKGLAFASAAPAADVSTLEALALAAGSQRSRVAALLDARRGDVYAAAFGPGERELLAEGLYPAAVVAERLATGCILTGDGARLHRDLFAGAACSPAEPCMSPAEAVARLGLRRLERGLARPAAELVPHYLRRAEAEARRLGIATESKNPF